jgi:hypothetical protein
LGIDNVTRRNQNQITSGYRRWVPAVADKARDLVKAKDLVR